MQERRREDDDSQVCDAAGDDDGKEADEPRDCTPRGDDGAASHARGCADWYSKKEDKRLGEVEDCGADSLHGNGEQHGAGEPGRDGAGLREIRSREVSVEKPEEAEVEDDVKDEVEAPEGGSAANGAAPEQGKLLLREECLANEKQTAFCGDVGGENAVDEDGSNPNV